MNELVRWDPFKTALPFEGSLLDANETENACQVAIELPGVQKDAIQVSVHENTVTIAAEAAEGEEHNWLVRERKFGKFSRNITLPEAVDDTSSEARYTDGVLYVTLQKKRQAKRLTIH